LIVALAILASFAFVTTSLSILNTVPDDEIVISHLSQSVSAGIDCILSYTAFLVGTSSELSHPAQYASSGTIISPVNVHPLFSALSVLRVSKLSFILPREVGLSVSDDDSDVSVLIG